MSSDAAVAVPPAPAATPAGLSPAKIAELNARYAPLSFEERLPQLYRDFPLDKVLVTDGKRVV